MRTSLILAAIVGAMGLGSSMAGAQVKIYGQGSASALPAIPPIRPLSGLAPGSGATYVPPAPRAASVARASVATVGGRAKYEPAGEGVYHGASLPDAWSENGLRKQIADYDAAAGKKISVVTWFASAYENGRMTNWSQNYVPNLARVKRMGAVSLIKFSTQDYAYENTHKIADLRLIANGTWDEYFKQSALAIKQFGGPVFISIDHEMNGTWYPYSEAYPGSQTTAEDYVAAWKRIVDIFNRNGATNVAWVWSPNVPDVGGVPYQDYYPGDDYVDWIGVSLYSGNDPRAMDTIYNQFSARKPFFITEWATAPEKNKYNARFPGEVEWVKDFFQTLNENYPRVKAISWFNWNKDDGDYRLQRVPAQARAYAQDVAAPRYLDSAETLVGQNSQPALPRLDIPSREVILRDVTPVVNYQPVAPPVVAAPVVAAPVVATPVKRSVLDGIKWQNVPIERVPVR